MITLPTWTSDVWSLLLPVLIVCGTALVVMSWDLVRGERRSVPWSIPTVVGLVLAMWAVLARWDRPLPEAEAVLFGAFRMDNLAVFLDLLILGAATLCLASADTVQPQGDRPRAEFFILALFSTTGMMLLVSSGDLITLFLGLELLSFPTYALCAYRRNEIKSNEAALKYFVLGSFASALLLYGVALLWGATGTTNLNDLRSASSGALAHLGMLLILVGFLFKIGSAPFHMWIPDVYEGAPTPVTVFMATTVKVAAFGAFIRVVLGSFVHSELPLEEILWWLACITMIVGNLSALTQENIKRMLAFSSVAHAGTMLVGLTAVVATGSWAGATAVLFYLLAYGFMNIGAFTVVILLARRAEGGMQFERDWSGAARRHPFLGIAMVVFMVALGGIPPTAGFFGKYSIFKAAIDAGLVSLVVIAVLNSLVSVYYYLRVVVALYMRAERPAVPGVLEMQAGVPSYGFEGPGAMAGTTPGLSRPLPRLAETGAWVAKLVVLVCLLATLWLGLGPSRGDLPGLSRILQWAETAVWSLR